MLGADGSAARATVGSRRRRDGTRAKRLFSVPVWAVLAALASACDARPLGEPEPERGDAIDHSYSGDDAFTFGLAHMRWSVAKRRRMAEEAARGEGPPLSSEELESMKKMERTLNDSEARLEAMGPEEARRVERLASGIDFDNKKDNEIVDDPSCSTGKGTSSGDCCDRFEIQVERGRDVCSVRSGDFLGLFERFPEPADPEVDAAPVRPAARR